MHPKVQLHHLEKIACLYLRQSTPKQVIEHKESPRVQLRLKDKLYELGFTKVEVIDTDLGKSGSGYQEREGFVKMLNDVCLERVGAVAAWEASRLARNHFEWQNLIRFCQITGTLVIDESGVYDPTNLDDVVMLGIKATMCEYELNILMKRVRAGLLEKARRGELYTVIPSGYYLTEDIKLEKVPDDRIRETIQLVFDKFEELGSANQVFMLFREEKIEFPKVRYPNHKRVIVWELPSYETILGVIKQPAYGGAYVYGRSETRTFIRDNRPVKTSGHEVDMEDWKVLIPNHHPGYISWEQYLRNQKQLRENTYKPNSGSPGAARVGSSLLAGLLHCGRCGRKLHVKYSGRDGKFVRYICRGSYGTTRENERCFSIGGAKLEQAIVREVLKVVQPAAISAAIEAEKRLSAECSERQKMLELALQQARYESGLRQRQFEAIDPDNRLVIRAIQAEWDQALSEVDRLEKELETEKECQRSLEPCQRNKFFALAEDLPRLWNLASTDYRTKKRIIRTLIEMIVAEAEPDNELNRFTIHWVGGVHSEITLKRNNHGRPYNKTGKEPLEVITELSQVTDDGHIARILNRCGLKTGTGKSWNKTRVKGIRIEYKIPAFSIKKYESSGLLNLGEAASELGLSPVTVRRLISLGIIQAKQIVRYAPWIIHRSELKKVKVIEVVKSIKKSGKITIQTDQQQLSL